jgi:hypothetical protein
LDDEDEVLAELADALGGLIDNIGNSNAHVLFSPLEKLCFSEDSIVRDKVPNPLKTKFLGDLSYQEGR